MRVKRIRYTLGNEKGQNLVEFALVVPMLLLLVFGIAEFGRAWMTKNILTGAAREAVRVAVVGGNGEARGDNVLASANIPPSTVVTETTEPDGHVTTIATVTYDFPVLFAGFIPGLDNATIPLSSTTTMRREY
ncbi:pilus assembly protein [bacterium]|nr:pilus assembly protein [bacterium]